MRRMRLTAYVERKEKFGMYKKSAAKLLRQIDTDGMIILKWI
jgi:hypothetical protein